MTNTTTAADVFSALSQLSDDPTEMIDAMVNHFRTELQAPELFEALKMRVRHRLGLPLVVSENDAPRPDDVEQQLELGLLEACKEAGQMLIKQGRVGEGWMYLRPTGDIESARQAVAEVEVAAADNERAPKLNAKAFVARDVGAGSGP